MLTCKEVSHALAADALRDAGFGRRVAIRTHLLMCESCRKFAQELEEIGEAMRRLAKSSETHASDASAEERILARLRESRGRDEV
jgi:anti-sigma factor ChrR (cupin superfamily)